MSLSVLAPALAGVVLVVAAAVFALLPFLRGRLDERAQALSSDEAAAVDAAAQRYRIYRQILELEFDEQTGKLSPEDCRELTAALLMQAGRLLVTDSTSQAEVEAEIEEEIAQARRAFTGRLVVGTSEVSA